jgi:Domain of unknown function (DUF5753)/Helix-turn-helix domain
VTATEPEGRSAGGPTVLRMLVGAQLRLLREAKGITRETAGWEIRASESKISRMELGRVGFKERDVADLLTLYEVTDEGQRSALLDLAREANTPGWWQRYNDIAPSWLQPYLGLEAAASVIRVYEVQFVHGLLQTPDYARAVIRIGYGSARADEIARRVELRMSRKQLLSRPNAPHLWVVLDEGVLRRPIGGRDVMRGQIEALIGVVKQPNVTLQVVPFHVGGHSAAGGAFTLLRFPEQEVPDLVYMEQITSALYLDRPEDVDVYAEVMENLLVEAEPPARTVEILQGVLNELTSADE